MHLPEQDIVEQHWGMRMYGYFSTGSEAFVTKDGSAFVPRTRAALFGSERALVLAFRGSEPTNLINLRSAGRHALSCWRRFQNRAAALWKKVAHNLVQMHRISMTERSGLGGRVHDGFYGALFHGDEEAGLLFNDLVAGLSPDKALYVTGERGLPLDSPCDMDEQLSSPQLALQGTRWARRWRSCSRRCCTCGGRNWPPR